MAHRPLTCSCTKTPRPGNSVEGYIFVMARIRTGRFAEFLIVGRLYRLLRIVAGKPPTPSLSPSDGESVVKGRVRGSDSSIRKSNLAPAPFSPPDGPNPHIGTSGLSGGPSACLPPHAPRAFLRSHVIRRCDARFH